MGARHSWRLDVKTLSLKKYQMAPTEQRVETRAPASARPTTPREKDEDLFKAVRDKLASNLESRRWGLRELAPYKDPHPSNESLPWVFRSPDICEAKYMLRPNPGEPRVTGAPEDACCFSPPPGGQSRESEELTCTLAEDQANADNRQSLITSRTNPRRRFRTRLSCVLDYAARCADDTELSGPLPGSPPLSFAQLVLPVARTGKAPMLPEIQNHGTRIAQVGAVSGVAGPWALHVGPALMAPHVVPALKHATAATAAMEGKFKAVEAVGAGALDLAGDAEGNVMRRSLSKAKDAIHWWARRVPPQFFMRQKQLRNQRLVERLDSDVLKQHQTRERLADKRRNTAADTAAPQR